MFFNLLSDKSDRDGDPRAEIQHSHHYDLPTRCQWQLPEFRTNVIHVYRIRTHASGRDCWKSYGRLNAIVSLKDLIQNFKGKLKAWRYFEFGCCNVLLSRMILCYCIPRLCIQILDHNIGFFLPKWTEMRNDGHLKRVPVEKRWIKFKGILIKWKKVL